MLRNHCVRHNSVAAISYPDPVIGKQLVETGSAQVAAKLSQHFVAKKTGH
jgi:hypothetical protein